MMSWGLCRIPAGRVKQSFVAACSARRVHLKKPPENTEEENSEPMKFTTSKGSHRTWTVEKSFGSEYQRPWWKVLPVSLTLTAFLLWIYFREETEIDQILYRPIGELLEEIEKKQKEEQEQKGK